jgi:hypothetical protein
MRTIVLTSLFATVVFGASSGAFAQPADVYVYPDEPYSYEESAPAPPVYQYRSDRSVVLRPVRPANCGEYRYWNGERCVDARDIPPDIR